MQPLDLNLASRPFKNDTLPWIALVTAIVGLTVLTVWNIRSYRNNAHLAEDLRQQYAATRTEMDEFDGRERVAQRDIEGYNLEALVVRADKANEVIRWKAFSWTQLFNKLQEVLPNDAQMVGIRPVFRPQGGQRNRSDPERGRVPVSVEGVAKNLDAFFELERALIKHPNFDRVDPGGHTQDRTRSVSFQLKFMYDPNPVIEEEVAEVARLEDEDEGEPSEGAPDAGEPVEQAGENRANLAETTGSGPEIPGAASLATPDAPQATVEPADAAALPTEVVQPGAAADEMAPPPPGQEEAMAEQDVAPKKPGRRKSGKRRAGSGRGTEGDR